MNDNTREQLKVIGLELTFDPAVAEIELDVDGVAYGCTVLAVDQSYGSTAWSAAVHTNQFFAGPAVPAEDLGDAVVLGLGRHELEIRFNVGGSIRSKQLPPLVVRPSPTGWVSTP